MTFLERSAEFILKHYEDQLSSLCIVLPNKRASLFLKNHLAKHIDQPFFAPVFYTIEEVAEQLSGLRIIDNTNLIFQLYRVHQNIEKENAQTFDQFIRWGNVLIADFNDIDQYLVEADSLYSYLSETKVIDKWTLGEEPLTEFELNYLRFFNSLIDYYKLFTSNLLEQKQGYQGLVSKNAADSIADQRWTEKYHKIIFIGFNALTASEEKIIRTMIRTGQAEVLWDTDAYYMDNEIQEAGKFLRNYKRQWNLTGFNWVDNAFKEGKKKIEVIGVPKTAGQVKITGELISGIPGDAASHYSTAIVLADEALLLPMLNSIPSSVRAFNVTMGLGLEHTPLYALLESIMSLHENAERIRRLQNHDQERFLTRDLLNILKHPYSRSLDLIDKSAFEISSFIVQLTQSNQVFITPGALLGQLENAGTYTMAYFSLIFRTWEDPVSAMRSMMEIIQCLRDVFILKKEETEEDQKLEFEYLYAFSKAITNLVNILETYKLEIGTKTLRKVFNNILSMSSLPFYGEPLEGIQIMGMLETRALDFEKIILLSANEGILPTGKNYQSFIPFDIRREFKLPTYREKDAIFAYHFYRLTQRAKDITLVYNTEADELGGGDKSRFITQLMYEMPKYNPGIQISEHLLGSDVRNELPAPIEIPKDASIIDKLKSKAEKGFSPSSINLYIRCPLKFYFTEILGLSEPEEIDESIDAATMGSVVHQALKKLITPYINQQLQRDKIKINEKEIEKEVHLAFRQYYTGGDTDYGKNYLITRVAVQWIKRMVHADIFDKTGGKSQSWIIRYLEERFTSNINIETGNGSLPILIKGTIDRVDELDGHILVMDYKTGMVNPTHLNIKDWEDLEHDANYAQALQLLIYSYLYLQNNPDKTVTCNAGILSVPKSSQGLLPIKLKSKILEINQEEKTLVVNVIISILEKIFDPNNSFSQTEELENCKYCPYIRICGR